MALVNFSITKREPYEGGKIFGDTGAYERIDAIAEYAVDPELGVNAVVTDLALAPRDEHGKVRFRGDVTLLRPADPSKANRALLVEVPNRGHRIALRQLNMAPIDLEATAALHSGDGYLFRAGWTVAWAGWQWDVPRSDARIGLEPPFVPAQALSDASADSGSGTAMQLRVQPDAVRTELPLTDQHVGLIGRHNPIPPADLDDADARLLVRDTIYGPATTIARDEWRFGRGENGEPDAQHVWLRGGFQPGKIYDVIYRPAECPVVGASMLAVRDLGQYLMRDASAPTAGTVDHAIAEGISQCGRFLRTFLHFGMNEAETGERVYDGMLIHVAGGRRGEFNHRYGQPSVQPTPSFGHRFPFTDAPTTDPATGRSAGLLDRLSARDCLPHIFYTDTGSEYWRGDAGLTHCDPGTGADVPLPRHVRRYLFSSTQHGPGQLPFAVSSSFGSSGENTFNVVDYRPLYRASLESLRAWVAGGTEPPADQYPRASDNTVGRREAVLRDLAKIPGLGLPNVDAIPRMVPLDLGERVEQGIGRFPAEPVGAAYPDQVSTVDEDGNDVAGIRTPDLTVPVATHTGFNPRRSGTGGEGQMLEYIGSTLPFAKTAAERAATGDPRRSLEERYDNRDAYLDAVRAAAQALVSNRYLLVEDVELCVSLAAERYDAVLAK